MKRGAGAIIIMLFLMAGYLGVTGNSKNPGNLCYYPESHDFGYKREGENDMTTFEIWACCGCAGSINYVISEDCDWVEVEPKSGTSYGEKDTITVKIDTTGLDEGAYSCPIMIESNNGEGVFRVSVKVAEDNEPPNVNIVEPEKGWLYLYDKKKARIGATVIIGKGTIVVDATDDKTEIEKVEIYIGNQLMKTDFVEPYTYLWIEPGFGLYVVKAVAYDSFSNTATAKMLVWKFL